VTGGAQICGREQVEKKKIKTHINPFDILVSNAHAAFINLLYSSTSAPVTRIRRAWCVVGEEMRRSRGGFGERRNC
jgi:hypothetical protein